jgi:hypothetical protein
MKTKGELENEISIAVTLPWAADEPILQWQFRVRRALPDRLADTAALLPSWSAGDDHAIATGALRFVERGVAI